jgi:hypothetical protein
MSKLSEARENSKRDKEFVEKMERERLFLCRAENMLSKALLSERCTISVSTHIHGRQHSFSVDGESPEKRTMLIEVITAYIDGLKNDYLAEAGEAWNTYVEDDENEDDDE